MQSPNGEDFTFRPFSKSDAEVLGDFFESLSDQTRSKFGPHPLTLKYVKSTLCKQIGVDNVSRFVIESQKIIVGYFIVDFNEYPEERARYSSYGIDLNFSIDPVFAPCIHDEYQGQGIASFALKALLQALDKSKVKSLVLMGGTQELNTLARHFYKKFDFQELGEFYTEHNNLNNVDMRLML